MSLGDFYNMPISIVSLELSLCMCVCVCASDMNIASYIYKQRFAEGYKQ